MRDSQPTTLEMALELGLSAEEFSSFCDKLGRSPSVAELGVLSAMYSEHCSYKSSRPFLKKFPTKGPRVLQGPGENAGIIDIGDGWAIVFKMESHNHPSFIEPYQGAATGVGGILRDIFTMGARPIALMDGLCFGEISDKKTQSIVRGVVKGIGDYGNSVGVPTVAGQTTFHRCYNKNPLVNAFTLGILRHSEIHRGTASGPGNPLIYVGAKTGRDGVHGASMASREFSSEKELDRPAVQVGDPFTEKLLLEASLEAMRAGLVVGIQDMGAAGITSSSFEMAYRAKTGLEIDLDRVPLRESGMSAFEILLSESQERMLLVATPEAWEPLRKIFEKWDLHAEVIGKVVSGNSVKMTFQGETVVHLPVELVADTPIASRPFSAPKNLEDLWFLDSATLKQKPLSEKWEALLSDPQFAHSAPLIEQYDSMVGVRTVGEVLEDAAVLRLREAGNKKIAITLDGNSRISFLSPREGGRRTVAEAALNLAVRGSQPVGLTDCLNFGSPENPEVLWQFSESVEGISEACAALQIPVVSGNVSFYNDTDGKPIYPTPLIGMVGLFEKNLPVVGTGLFSEGLEIALLGKLEAGLGGSLLSSQIFHRECGKPEETDLEAVKKTLSFLQELHKCEVPLVAHDISDGGLALAALEMSFHSPSKFGMTLTVPEQVTDLDSFLFGEALPRILLAYAPNQASRVAALAQKFSLPLWVVGKSTDEPKLKIHQATQSLIEIDIKTAHQKWQQKWKELF